MFQSSSFVLMNLDSKIVQMNIVSSLLLVSTLNRCYICDTVLEQYKQIGNKPRDGEFGACFLKTTHTGPSKSSAEAAKTPQPVSNVKQVFRMSREVVNGIDEASLPKVYCARPGSRLWEVTATGTVVKTHQLKEALAIAPLPVYKPSIGKLLKLKKKDQAWPMQSINFPQLLVINRKYLFSFTSIGLYVFDPGNAEVVLWNDEFPDILMAHTIDDKIYLMTTTGVFHCLTLASINHLILKLYGKKSYKECLEICQILKPQLVSSVKQQEQPCDVDFKESTDISDILVPIVAMIKSNQNTQPMKLESGIVVVNNGNKNSSNDDDSILYFGKRAEETENVNDLSDLFTSLNTNGTSDSPIAHKKSKDGNHYTEESATTNGLSQETRGDEASSLQIIISNIQTDLLSLHLSISSQMKPDITEKQLEEVIKLFVDTLDNVMKKYDEVSSELQNYLFKVIHSAQLHYSNSLLENVPLELLRRTENREILKQLVKIFVEINSLKYVECCCGFPYPVFGTGASKSTEPKFLDIGRVLLDKLLLYESDDACLQFCNKIPYMWRDYLFLKEYTKQRIPDVLLQQCLQIRDNLVLSLMLPLLDTQQWKVAAQCFENIKNGRCVSCGKPYDGEQVSCKEFDVDWPGIIYYIVKKHGCSKAMTFLRKVHENLPQVVFEKRYFY